ncbi:hypothetical protein CF138_17305 [Aeromonas hydrophila]|uniref:hypothetical protein n=1 Tax=Aeromonas hydrophila TaxID=644 RepID=UPI001115C257|nr:hypothetical protein [Aeromonas hydrophila]TNH82858.1 hypothetical protein CF138_17305 [Aeromonas hydrophila]TNI00243.1 hypothetical protein CF136_10610 [Aeromonas hydrophila]TNI92876.1 hypothetical protein CF118_18030 [Aeromonas hydrophila]
MFEHTYGVSIDVLIQLRIVDAYTNGYILNPYFENKNAHIIKAIREDETGFTAAMYGITNNNEKE